MFLLAVEAGSRPPFKPPILCAGHQVEKHVNPVGAILSFKVGQVQQNQWAQCCRAALRMLARSTGIIEGWANSVCHNREENNVSVMDVANACMVNSDAGV
jgi:hypothetical protein